MINAQKVVFSPRRLSQKSQTRSLWSHLNDLRGFCSARKMLELDLMDLERRLAAFRDEISTHYMQEWGVGDLNHAVLNRMLSAEQFDRIRAEQAEIFELAKALASDAKELLHSDEAPQVEVQRLMDCFLRVDSLLIVHETRKHSLLRNALMA